MSDYLQKLEELKKLKDEGVLSDEEFEREKKKILAEGDKPAPQKITIEKKGGCAASIGVIAGAVILLVIIGLMSRSCRKDPDAHVPLVPPPPENVLELQNWSWYEQYDYLTVEGRVKNISSRSLENVEAVVSFLDKDGAFVSSDNALIEYKTLLAGQTSPFKVIAHGNPAIKSASIEFKELMGDKLGHTSK